MAHCLSLGLLLTLGHFVEVGNILGIRNGWEIRCGDSLIEQRNPFNFLEPLVILNIPVAAN